MSTSEIISLIGLLVVIAGLFAAQWRGIQNQRDADKKELLVAVSELRQHGDSQDSALHKRVDDSATKTETAAVEARLSNTLRRIEDKLDRVIERRGATRDEPRRSD